jgi:Ni,Fe-hydrogenase III large subunit
LLHFGELSRATARLPCRGKRPAPGTKAVEDPWLGNLLASRENARQLGMTGFAARASGLVERDLRLVQSTGYEQLDHLIRTCVEDTHPHLRPDQLLQTQILQGDIFSRALLRVREAKASMRIIDELLRALDELSNEEHLPESTAAGSAANYDFSLGCAEGARGDVVYWLMRDKFHRIFRCKVRDPSCLNWPALAAAVGELQDDQPADSDANAGGVESPAPASIQPDFPLINKSYNLSYSGRDL